MLHVDVNELVSFVINLHVTRNGRCLGKPIYIFEFGIKNRLGSDKFILEQTEFVPHYN